MISIDPHKALEAGQVKVQAFWNGTIMFNHIFDVKKYNELVKDLNNKFIDDEDIQSVVEELDRVEESYRVQDRSTGRGYVVDLNQAFTHLLFVNDLVNNKKVIANDDMFGLLIMSAPKRTGNTNSIPKKKKRK